MRIPGVDEAFVVFAGHDSGCLSYGAEAERGRWFVKRPVNPAGRAALTRAVTFHTAVRHPAIVRPLFVADDADGPILVYPWCEGVVLNQAVPPGGADRSALERFRALPLAPVLAAGDALLDAHRAAANAGFVAVDLYDGCFLYDFGAGCLRLIDLDEYRPGPFAVEGLRLPGSRRYMAPEELVPGATVDERATVHDLGRSLLHLLAAPGTGPAMRSEGRPAGWRGGDGRWAVVERATRPHTGERYETVAELSAAWRGAAGHARQPDGPPGACE